MRRTFIAVAVFLCVVSMTGCGSPRNPAAPVVVPVITAIHPQNGGPGTFVTVQGSGFGSTRGASLISFSGVNLLPSSWSENVITLTLPSHSRVSGTFVITVNGQVSAPSAIFTVAGPVLFSISPANAPPGSQVTLAGQHFGQFQASSHVVFNSIHATSYQLWSDSRIVCTVPSWNQSGQVSVMVWVDGNNPTNPLDLNVVHPTVASVNQSDGYNVGARMIISGNGFGFNKNSVNGAVTVSGIPATIAHWSDTSITAYIPQVSAAGSFPLIVNSNGIQTPPSHIHVRAPELLSHSPANPDNGIQITISGNHFGSSNQILRTIELLDHNNRQANVTGVFWTANTLRFTWPFTGAWMDNRNARLRVTIGTLSSADFAIRY